MFGEISYGKAVDIWAAGFIMFELISNHHPLWNKGEYKPTYRDKLKNLKQLDFSKGKFSRYAFIFTQKQFIKLFNFFSLAINLIEKFCQMKPSSRYKAE